MMVSVSVPPRFVTEFVMTSQKPDFPGWMTPWCNEVGRWWAVRETRLSRAQRNAGCAVSVSADSIEVLAEVIRLQDELAVVAGGGA
jgi:hypothetical protein